MIRVSARRDTLDTLETAAAGSSSKRRLGVNSKGGNTSHAGVNEVPRTQSGTSRLRGAFSVKPTRSTVEQGLFDQLDELEVLKEATDQQVIRFATMGAGADSGAYRKLFNNNPAFRTKVLKVHRELRNDPRYLHLVGNNSDVGERDSTVNYRITRWSVDRNLLFSGQPKKSKMLGYPDTVEVSLEDSEVLAHARVDESTVKLADHKVSRSGSAGPNAASNLENRNFDTKSSEITFASDKPELYVKKTEDLVGAAVDGVGSYETALKHLSHHTKSKEHFPAKLIASENSSVSALKNQSADQLGNNAAKRKHKRVVFSGVETISDNDTIHAIARDQVSRASSLSKKDQRALSDVIDQLRHHAKSGGGIRPEVGTVYRRSGKS
jgi:hypothetical protein